MTHYLDYTSEVFFFFFFSSYVGLQLRFNSFSFCMISIRNSPFHLYCNMLYNTYLIIYILLLLPLIGHSLLFFNVWHSCVDVSVEENYFPVSLIQSSVYYQVCASSQEHWRRFGSSQFRMHILRTTEPMVDKVLYIQHNGYVHFHNESRLTVAKWYGATHEEL